MKCRYEENNRHLCRAKKKSDDFPEVKKNTGWHVSLRGYKRDWDFPEVMKS